MDTKGKSLYDKWEKAINTTDLKAITQCLKISPQLINQGIIHYRGNGTTFQTLPLNLVNQSLATTELLIEYNADPNEYGDGHVLALHNASPDVTEYLISKGADVNKIGYEECTPIMYEVYMHNIENVAILIKHGADINYQRNLDGYTSLHWAARKGDVAIAKLLVQHGARTDISNEENKLAADLAKENNHQALIEYLKMKA